MSGQSCAIGMGILPNFEALVAFIRRKAGRRLLARESATDLAQSTLREMVAAADRVGDRSEVGLQRWLYRAAECKIRNRARYWRATKRDAPELMDSCMSSDGDGFVLPARDPGPSTEYQLREVSQAMQAALRSLPDDQREIILLRNSEGLSHAEIARRMGRSEVAVRKLLSRALARFAAELETGGAG